MSHVFHADVHDEGLADDCPACGEAAENPTGNLDERMLVNLVERAVDRASGNPQPPRSYNEEVAEVAVLNTLERVGRLAECNPGEVARYLTERWALPCRIEPRRPAGAALACARCGKENTAVTLSHGEIVCLDCAEADGVPA